MTTIEQYVNAATNLSRRSRYQVQIDGNDVFGASLFSNQSEKLSIMLNCASASFPGTVLGTNENDYFGLAFNYPSDYKFTALDLEFYVDTDFTEKKFFQKWLDSIYDVQTGRWSFLDQYAKDIYIISLDLQSNPRYKIRLEDAYPVNVGQINVGHALRNQVATLPVTVQFYRMLQQDI